MLSLDLAPQAKAGFIGGYALGNFTLTNVNADGAVTTPDGGLSIVLTGGNNGSGLEGRTDLVIASLATGVVQFKYSYSTFDLPGFDSAGYLVDGAFTQLANSDGQVGTVQFPVGFGRTFGFRVVTFDNTGEPGILTVSDFSAPGGEPSPVPEPHAWPMLLVAAAAGKEAKRRMSRAELRKEEQA